MGRIIRATLWMWLAMSTAMGANACKHYVKARTYGVEPTTDAKSTYAALREVLDQAHYDAVDQNPAAQTVRVRAHTDESEAGHGSFIDAEVSTDGSVVFRPSGSAVRPDGTISTRLSNEIAKLERQVSDRLRHDSKAAKGHEAAAAKDGASSSAGGSSPPATAAEGGLPRAWNERAYDPKTWGDGEFTCIPAKLPADGRLLKLRLSTNEEADVSISIAYDQGLCRSGCPIPGGCPALGLGDAKQVARLAERLEGGQIESTATVLLDGKAVATFNLRKHGSIDQSIRQLKHQL